MKVNINLLDKAVYDKIYLMSLHAIVNETFIGGLPMPRKSFSPTDIRDLTDYSFKALECLGGKVLIDKAKESLSTDIRKLALIKRIDSICTETAKKATKRTLRDIEDSGETINQTLEEVVGDVTLNKKEVADLAQMAKNLDMDAIRQKINEKVISTVEKERIAYSKTEELKEELKDAVAKYTDKDNDAEDDDETDETSDDEVKEEEDESEEDTEKKSTVDKSLKNKVDSSMDSFNNIHKFSAKEHISLFSKLQEKAYESLLYINEYDDLPMAVINDITFEHSLASYKKPKTYKDAITSLENYRPRMIDVTDEENRKLVSNGSLTASTVIYTLMETFNTLNLHTPSIMEIKEFVDNNEGIYKVNKQPSVLMKTLKNFTVAVKESSSKLSENDLKSINNILDKYRSVLSYSNLENSAIEAATAYIMESENVVYDTCEKEEAPTLETEETKVETVSYYTNLKHTENISNFKKLANTLKNKPGLTKVIFTIPSVNTDESYVVYVKYIYDVSINSSTPEYKPFTDFVPVIYIPEMKMSVISYIKECINLSEISLCKAHMELVVSDTGETIIL